MSLRTERLVVGAMAGLAATVPMTVFMVFAHRLLPRRQRFELPPARTTGAALRQAKIYGPLEPAGAAVTLVSHFGYGAAIGAVYRGYVDPQGEPSVFKGIAYGLGVWAGSYLGWLPASGLHRSAAVEPLARNLLMVAAHVVWGASYYAVLDALSTRERRSSSAGVDKGEADMGAESESYTIIHKSSSGPAETLATGLSREQAEHWLHRQAGETGSSVSSDLIVHASTSSHDESWQAIAAE